MRFLLAFTCPAAIAAASAALPLRGLVVGP
jgi:hypothetical protein